MRIRDDPMVRSEICWIVDFQDAVIVRVRAYLDSAMDARLFDESPIA
jgi:hypothetical protein